MIAVYTAAVFVGAALVFLVQPLIAKQLLPRLGGSPAVWNACMVFFQAALLAGYGYAHAIRAIRDPRKAAGVHLLFLLVPLACCISDWASMTSLAGQARPCSRSGSSAASVCWCFPCQMA